MAQEGTTESLRYRRVVGLCMRTRISCTIESATNMQKSCYYWQNNNKHTLFSKKNKDKSNEVTWGFFNIISGWCSMRFTPAFSTPALLMHFPLLHFPPLQFCPYRIFYSRIFSRPLSPTKCAFGRHLKPNICTLWGKKTAPFYFCNSFVRTSSFTTMFGTRIHQ